MNVECSENTTVDLEESLSCLQTLANFGGTLLQSKQLEQKKAR